GRTIYLNAVITDYHRWRLKPPEGGELRKLMAAAFALAGVKPQYEVTRVGKGDSYGVELHPYLAGDLRMLALHRNYQLRVGELGPPIYRKQDALAGDMRVKVALGSRMAVYNQRTGKYLGKSGSVTVKLATHQPTILALLPEPVKAMTMTAPEAASRGKLVKVKLRLDGPKLGKTHAFRVRVTGPDGKELRELTQTLAAPGGAVTWDVALALTDPAGTYRLYARDVATGIKAERKLKAK
ncbi:hypothetical protein LCGC14_3141170, partial [marine sediment metagenome]